MLLPQRLLLPVPSANVALDSVDTVDGSDSAGNADQTLANGDAASFLLNMDGSDVETLNVSGTVNNTTSSSETDYTGYGMVGLGGALTSLTTFNGAFESDVDLGLYNGLDAAVTNLETMDFSDSSGGVLSNLSSATTVALSLTSYLGGSGDDFLKLELAANVDPLNVDLGAGDDELELKASSSYVSDQITIDGGDGENTLILDDGDADPTTLNTTFQNFQVVSVNTKMDGTTTDVSKFGATKFETTADTNSATGIVEGLVSGGTVLLGADVDDTTLDIDLSDAGGTGDVLNVETAIDTGSASDLDLDVTGSENLNLSASESAKGDGSSAAQFDLTGADLREIAVDAGDIKMDINLASGGTAISSVDASSTSGDGSLDVKLSGSAVVGAEITGTANNDVIKGSSKGDVITAGDGDDDITGLGGDDEIDLTAGGSNDIFFIEANEGTDTITGFTTYGDGSVADPAMDRIVLSADSQGGADVFDSGESNQELKFAGTSSLGSSDDITTLVEADYAEFEGVASGGSDIENDHVNVITSTGYEDVDAALDANGADNNTNEALIVFYNTTSEAVEVFYATEMDGNGSGSGVASTGSTLASLPDIEIAGLADFDHENFAILQE
ncbi:UNVERIFIED_CONTAM: hypothetical protein K0B97_09055 [Spiribacter pallidus]